MESEAQLLSDFEKVVGVAPRQGVLGRVLTTFCIGGPIRFLVDLQTPEQVQACVAFLKAHALDYQVLGAGSNLLIPDTGVAGWVLRPGTGLRYLKHWSDGVFEAGAGLPIMTLSRKLCAAGCAGLEFAGGIPGSVGGAVRMNAGAHGSEIAQVLRAVHLINDDGRRYSLKAEEIQFGYRSSNLPQGAFVLSAVFRTVKTDPTATQARRAAFLAERRLKQPLEYASAGSFFRNPSPQQSAGLLIEKAGLKGHRIGGAQISVKHANWIINPEKKASCAEVTTLMQLCQKRVQELFSLELIPEVVRW